MDIIDKVRELKYQIDKAETELSMICDKIDTTNIKAIEKTANYAYTMGIINTPIKPISDNYGINTITLLVTGDISVNADYSESITSARSCMVDGLPSKIVYC